MSLPITKFQDTSVATNYVPSDDEMEKIWYIKRRFHAMQQARTIVDKNWETYQTMVNAYFLPYPDERSSSTVPLASSLIELYVAEATKVETIYQFRGETSKYATQAKALEYVWKYDWRKKNRKRIVTEMEYIAATFWDAIIYTWAESYEKEQLDPIPWPNGSVQFVKKRYKENGIVVENVDIRNFYIDNSTIKWIEDASDCIWKQRESFERFQQRKFSKVYKNIDKVKPCQFSNDYKTFVMPEETIKKWEFIQLMHYWNVDKDMYVVIANWVIIREHPMTSTIDWKKALPFTIRGLWYKTYSIYHRGICEPLMMFNSELNTLREMLMDAIRRSNSQVLAIGNWLSFDGRTFSYDNEILTFDGNLANNFQQLSGNPPNQAIFNYLQQIYKDIAIFIGIDIQNILWQPQQTAYQTEVQREAAQKRINVWLTNRDLAMERFANLYKDLLQTEYTKKDANWLYPQLEIDGQQLITKDDGTQKFKSIKGKSMFECTPEILRGDIMIDAYTNTNAATINAVDREQKKDYLTTMTNIAQWYAVAKQSWLDLESVLPLKATLRDLAADYNFEPQNWESDTQEEAKKAKEELAAQLQGMMSGNQWIPWNMGTPPVEWEQPLDSLPPAPWVKNAVPQVTAPTWLS